MNVIFDLGGVVFTWQPEVLIQNLFNSKATQDIVRRQIFHHPDWVALDCGTLALDKAVKKAVKRTKLSSKLIFKLLSQQIPQALKPMLQSIDLIHSVKKAGHRVYVLSNMQASSIKHIERHYSFWDIFDGRVISCRVHKVKPEAAIYQHILHQFMLRPRHTIFIDDMRVNLDTAAKFGITPILFESAPQCTSELRKCGVL